MDTELIKQTIYSLCKKAAIEVSSFVYDNISEQYNKTKSTNLLRILKNAENAHNIQRPLCQDTGTVHVFIEIGNQISFTSDVKEAVEIAVKNCYVENFFRKSILNNVFANAKNTETNTPAIIDISYVKGNSLKIDVLLKGGGCDNMSVSKMLLPSMTQDELKDFVVTTILENGKNACPPLFVSIAVGGSSSSVMKDAEKGFFRTSSDLPELAEEIKNTLNSMAPNKYEEFFAADVKLSLLPHHMASLPVAISVNCHSLRCSSAIIENNSVKYLDSSAKFINVKNEEQITKEVFTNDTETIRNLEEGEEVLLTGDIIIARDSAHKKMTELKKKGENLPFLLKDKIIFYASPCPAMENEIVGPIGPTTAKRMDKFLPEFPEILATIGKGERSDFAKDFIKQNNSVYFEAQGGIATLSASRFSEINVIAFPELSSEAVCAAKINKFPVKVAITPKERKINYEIC